MKRSDLFIPQRQSIFAIVLILFKYARMMVRQFWPLLIVLVLGRKGSMETWLGMTFGILALTSLLGSVIAYFKFYYFISRDHLIIHKGVLRTIRLDLPFERIQTVDFEQNILHQAFGVVRVKIDSAGSKTEEVVFDALEKSQAEILRDYILEKKGALRQPLTAEEARHENRELILHLRPLDLFKIGVSQNHLRTAGIIFAFFFAMAEDLTDVFKDMDIFETISQEVRMMMTTSVFLALLAIPVFLVISFLVTLFRTVMVYFDLRFWKTARGFKLTSGLITRHEKSVQRNKIQFISWATNPIRKLFGIYKLNLYQASSVDVHGDKSMSVPGCYRAQIDRTIQEVMPGAVQAVYEEHGMHPAARMRFVLFAGLVPCVLLSALGVLTGRPLLIWVWLYFPVAIWMGWLYHRKKKLRLHMDFAVFRSGIFGEDWRLLELYKIQGVKVSQSFYQLRHDLATITLYTASGAIRMPFLSLSKAGQIRDYVLYRVERDRRPWM